MSINKTFDEVFNEAELKGSAVATNCNTPWAYAEVMPQLPKGSVVAVSLANGGRVLAVGTGDETITFHERFRARDLVAGFSSNHREVNRSKIPEETFKKFLLEQKALTH